MIAGSPAIALTLAVQMSGLLAYNVAGMAVTGHLGAVFRTVLETSRTLAVWVVDLILAATGAGGGKLGESWGPWSWVQAAGFCILVSGTLLYGRGDDLDARVAAAAALDGGASEDGAATGTATPTLLPTSGAATAATTTTAAIPAPGRRLSAASAASSHQRGTPLLGASFRATMTINAIGGSSLGGFAGGGGSVVGGGFGGIGGTGHGSGAVASFLAGRAGRDGGGSSDGAA